MARKITEKADCLPALAETFRRFGYEGATLARISKATGLGKGSLYYFFPGGKEDMAAAVLADIAAWFEIAIFAPLERSDSGGALHPRAAIDAMLANVAAYFQDGQRICLVGAFALDSTRDLFAAALRGYFARWAQALSQALQRGGHHTPELAAQKIIVAIQGAIVLGRALDDRRIFTEAIADLRNSFT